MGGSSSRLVLGRMGVKQVQPPQRPMGRVVLWIFPTVWWLERHLFSQLVSVARLNSNALQVYRSQVAAIGVSSFVRFWVFS